MLNCGIINRVTSSSLAEKEKNMKRNIKLIKATVSFEIMGNGESRLRITRNSKKNAFSYIRVHMPSSAGGGWQNAHFHDHTIETWIVERGCQIVLEEINDEIIQSIRYNHIT